MNEVDEELNRLGTAAEKRCAICDKPRTVHAKMELAGELHHRFSEQGELVQRTPDAPQARRVTATADLALRMALIEAGVITYDKLARAEAALRAVSTAGGRGPDGDREDRSTEGAERGGGATSPEEPPGQGQDGTRATQPEPPAA